MPRTKPAVRFAVACLLSGLASGQSALAEAVVKVTLWDKGESSMDMLGAHEPMGLGMPGADPAMATMGITLDVAEVPAGEVKFQIVNDSLEFYHAVTISPVEDVTVPLPYLAEGQRVDEAAAGVTASLGELKSHASATKTFTLEPGTYILYCNIAGHYAMGMWTLLTVTP
ncbi:MAG: hypothetical protein JNK34_01145 [Tabrizicola sp.]|nr:hypothetical protein [Tabrizicola sp.]